MNKPKHYLFLAVMVTAMLLVAGKLPESVGASQSTLATPRCLAPAGVSAQHRLHLTAFGVGMRARFA